jgi:hypothetical protein
LTFAIARHAVVDLSQVFDTQPKTDSLNRLDAKGLNDLYSALRAAGLETQDPEGQRLAHLRHMYEPYVEALAKHLQMPLPPWLPPSSQKDNWQTSAWEL